ncbi:MAG: DHH family phosphoesterase [Candidatus Norongarragalinales archaeon]
MSKERDEEGFFQRAEETAGKIQAMKNPLLVHHYDADGISSGAIVAFALKQKGIPFEMQVVKRFDEKTLELFQGRKEIIFTDIGSGQMQLVNSIDAEIALIDHHPAPEEPKESVLMCNPHDYGIDGTTELCSASTAYFCFRHLGERTITQLGIVGACGDLQDYAQSGFVGLNRTMVEEGAEKGHVFVNKDLRIFGRVSKPLVWFLTYTTEPFIPGLSGNEKACALFLQENGIPIKKNGEWLCYYDLNAMQRKKLASALIEYGKEKGLEDDVLETMVGDVYLFMHEPEKSELRDALEFSTLLNACGRHEQAALGVRVCLHEQGAYAEAKAILAEHRRQIKAGLEYAKKQNMDLGVFYFLDARGVIADSVIGIVAGGFFNSGMVERNKPIIAFSFDEEGKTKISGRANKTLVEKGLDLGEVMRKAGEAAGGLGGGHSIAAGCTIATTREAETKFLKKAKEVIQVQLEIVSK